MPSVVAGAVTVFWTAVYFVYFLFKGKQEWKCEKSKAPVIQYCCVDGIPCQDHHEHHEQTNGLRHRKPNGQENNNHNTTPKSFYSTNSGLGGLLKSAWSSVKSGAKKAWNFGQKAGRKVWNWVKTGAQWVWKAAKCLFYMIYAFIVSNNVPSQTLPSTPKPYSAKPSSPGYNKVAFEYDQDKLNEAELRAATKQEHVEEDEEDATVYEDVKKVPDTSESFYYQRVFEEPKEPKEKLQPVPEPPREKSIPPPPPPPPPPKPISREPSRARSMTPGRDRREVKGGIGGFKSDIMDELEERLERASANREMTQSCHPDMAQWKANEAVDRTSANSTPWRASSVGPTMRRLEQVVSRIEGDEEPNFVFRPAKIVHSSSEYQTRNKPADANFVMGRSVFSPVEEAEQMRQDINSQQQHSYSSPQYQSGNWMEAQRSRNVHVRNDQAQPAGGQQRNPFGSAAYKSSPYASHTARRSKTPVRNAEPEGGVESVARQWPPVSNATGAESGRDEWIGRSMRGVEDNDDGLVMTMCRRVVEKKKDENWKWRDESGRLLDERHNNTWKGELDTLLRDGPNEGRHWSRTVEKLPTGDTRFQDVNRQYNKEFVVESIVRNY